jgi:hypothetical protein
MYSNKLQSEYQYAGCDCTFYSMSEVVQTTARRNMSASGAAWFGK